MIVFALLTYAAAMTAANLLLVEFGKGIVPLNAFLLIGLDLALRDLLHVRLRAWQMLALIVGTGVITYALNPAAAHIAVASACAFTAAALADWAFFVRLSGSWLRRSNLSNVAGALVDSIVFPLLAFGGLDPLLVMQMFAAKVAGGAVWAYLLRRKAHAAV